MDKYLNLYYIYIYISPKSSPLPLKHLLNIINDSMLINIYEVKDLFIYKVSQVQCSRENQMQPVIINNIVEQLQAKLSAWIHSPWYINWSQFGTKAAIHPYIRASTNTTLMVIGNV